MGLIEPAGAMNFIGGALHIIEIESQEKVKEQEWYCHVGKYRALRRETDSRNEVWEMSGEEEFTYWTTKSSGSSG